MVRNDERFHRKRQWIDIVRNATKDTNIAISILFFTYLAFFPEKSFRRATEKYTKIVSANDTMIR